MEKMITIRARQVKDLGGLFIDLRKNSFDVRNVGSDQMGTYIYLDGDEDKDPTPFVEKWDGKQAPDVTKGEVRRRKEQIEKIMPRKPAPITTFISGGSRLPESEEPDPKTGEAEMPASSETDQEEQQPGFFKRLLRKISK